MTYHARARGLRGPARGSGDRRKVRMTGTGGRPPGRSAENWGRRDGIRAGAVSGPWRSGPRSQSAPDSETPARSEPADLPQPEYSPFDRRQEPALRLVPAANAQTPEDSRATRSQTTPPRSEHRVQHPSGAAPIPPTERASSADHPSAPRRKAAESRPARRAIAIGLTVALAIVATAVMLRPDGSANPPRAESAEPAAGARTERLEAVAGAPASLPANASGPSSASASGIADGEEDPPASAPNSGPATGAAEEAGSISLVPAAPVTEPEAATGTDTPPADAERVAPAEPATEMPHDEVRARPTSDSDAPEPPQPPALTGPRPGPISPLPRPAPADARLDGAGPIAPADARILIRVGTGTSPTRQSDLIATLRAAGYGTVELEAVPFEIARPRLGYYGEADRPAADALAVVISRFVDDLAVRNFAANTTRSAPGRFDLWLNG